MNDPAREVPGPADGAFGSRSHPLRPKRAHSQPIATAVPSEAANRATTICGWPGNAREVATRTTGLTAGAESRNASAAAGATPRRIKLPATGTDAHSHPGSTTPAAPATGTARAWLRGNSRVKTRSGTKAPMAAETSAPSRRNGMPWTTTAVNTVHQAATGGV